MSTYSPRLMERFRQQQERIQGGGLCGRQQGRYRVQTTDSNHDQLIAPKLMAQAPEAVAPNQIWVGDITYIETQEGWLYLAAILDRFSRQVVGWLGAGNSLCSSRATLSRPVLWR